MTINASWQVNTLKSVLRKLIIFNTSKDGVKYKTEYLGFEYYFIILMNKKDNLKMLKTKVF